MEMQNYFFLLKKTKHSSKIFFFYIWRTFWFVILFVYLIFLCKMQKCSTFTMKKCSFGESNHQRFVWAVTCGWILVIFRLFKIEFEAILVAQPTEELPKKFKILFGSVIKFGQFHFHVIPAYSYWRFISLSIQEGYVRHILRLQS